MDLGILNGFYGGVKEQNHDESIKQQYRKEIKSDDDHQTQFNMLTFIIIIAIVIILIGIIIYFSMKRGKLSNKQQDIRDSYEDD